MEFLLYKPGYSRYWSCIVKREQSSKVLRGCRFVEWVEQRNSGVVLLPFTVIWKNRLPLKYMFLVVHNSIRWLSRGSFLERFLNLLPEIITFLDTLGEKHEQLEDPVWVKKLVFLTDFMGHYNSLNLQLEEKGKNIIELFSSISVEAGSILSHLSDDSINDPTFIPTPGEPLLEPSRHDLEANTLNVIEDNDNEEVKVSLGRLKKGQKSMEVKIDTKRRATSIAIKNTSITGNLNEVRSLKETLVGHHLNKVQVCREMFIKTLNISTKRVNTALVNMISEYSVTDKGGCKQGGWNRTGETKKAAVTEHINRISKYKTHYCRLESQAEYLPPHMTMSKMYELYMEGKEKQDAVSFPRYKNIFYKNFNLETKALKKDTCNKCDMFTIRVENTQNENDKAVINREHNQHKERGQCSTEKT
ncbi:hypothetical protein ILUMI_00525 [Ignelater luminosus]|uniref:Uncharacterized protein n=1 Tax=Ignelater luminosus TaxID=2038154 RepID=A0A8K0DLQ8_IGNLU|nr:hypothetical protein ILUMI_00525 [Ignelater luminosus]